MQREILKNGGTVADTASLPSLLGTFWAGRHTVLLRSYLRLSAVPDSGHVGPARGSCTIFAPQLAFEEAPPAWKVTPNGRVTAYIADWNKLDQQPGWRVNVLTADERSSVFLVAARRRNTAVNWNSSNRLVASYGYDLWG
jgi:hypothetical protein